MKRWLVALALAVGLSAEAQPLTGGLLGRGASYTSFVPPAGCASGYVPYFDASLKLVCAPTVYAPATDTTTVGTLAARNVTATALPASGSVTVTPTLSKVGTITTVAGASLADGDHFTVEYAAGNTVPVEFDATPGDGTTGGRVPYVFAPGDTADQIRDGLITLLNGAAGVSLTASSGGAATVALVLDTPGAAGGTNTENVANAGFLVTGFVNPTAATTYTYSLQACLADGSCNAAGAASSTAAGHATLSAANFNRLSWSAVSGSALYKVRRDVGGATTGVIWSGTALTVDDTGLAGDGTGKPADDGTGSVTAGNYGTLVKTKNLTLDGGALTFTPVPAPGAATLTATIAGSKPAGTWNGKVTWVTATGETALGTVSSNITVDGSKAITVARPADPPSVATGWKWYSSKAGPTATWWVTSGTIPIATLTYDDNAADAALTQVGGQNSTAGRRALAGSFRAFEIGSTSLFFGDEAGRSLTYGGYLTGIGNSALFSATTALNSVGIGYAALRSATTTTTTTAIGSLAGYVTGATPSATNAVTTAVGGTFIGYGAGLGSATQRANAAAYGAGAYVDADNTVVLGNAAVTRVKAGSTSTATFEGAATDKITTTNALWHSASVTETTTIAAAAFTDTTISLPANSVIRAVVGKVTVAPPGTATMTVGDPTTAARFATGIATTLNTTFVGLTHVDQTGAAGPKQTTSAKVRFTPNAVPSDASGRVSVTIFYDQYTAPST